MKNLFITMFFLFISTLEGISQSYDTINVGYTTSVNLIFSSAVKKWDMGLGIKIENGQQVRDVLVENSSESPERIKIAAGIEHFETTNLFVETQNAYYNFILKYDPHPQNLLIKISPDHAAIKKESIEQPKEKIINNRLDSLAFIDTLKMQCNKIHSTEIENT